MGSSSQQQPFPYSPTTPYQKCYEFGLGLPHDYQEARRWYQLAAAQEPTKDTAPENLKRLNEKIRMECPLLGKRVVITGTSRENLNGESGVATSFDRARDRYVVKLDKEVRKEVSLMAKNLQARA